VTLNRFILNTPYYFTLVKNPAEFSFLIDLTSESSGEHFGGSVVRLFDASRIIGDRFRNRQQSRLDMPSRLVEEPFFKYNDDHAILIDPAVENAYYLSEISKWAEDDRIHPTIRNFARLVMKSKQHKMFRKWRKGKYWTLWNYDVARDPSLSNDLVAGTFDAELHYGSSTLLVPGPLIDDLVDLQTAFDLNEIGVANAVDKDAEFGNYFTLAADAILDKELRNTLTEFMAGSKVRLNVLKFKFLNLRAATMDILDAYADLYRRLAEIRERKKDKVFCVLENDCQAFVSAIVCFDLVSTSMTGYDRYPRGKAKEGYGGLFSANELAHIKFEKYKEVFVNNGERPLCDHKPCQKVDPRSVSKKVWYAYRRKDYILCMDDLMTKIANYIRDRSVEQARQDVTNSFMGPLRKLIPTDWESPPAKYPMP
jgi:hypothetical protein